LAINWLMVGMDPLNNSGKAVAAAGDFPRKQPFLPLGFSD
jgi:hypothetical protein